MIQNRLYISKFYTQRRKNTETPAGREA